MKGLIIFDLDGTLLCSHLHIYEAANRALTELNLPVATNGTIIKMIGETSSHFVKSIAPNYKDPQRLITVLRKYEREALSKNGTLFDGVADTLNRLVSDGFLLTICSSGSLEYIELALETTGIRHLFQTVVSSKSYTSKGCVVRNIIRASTSDNVIVVGDRIHDFSAAADNQIPSIGVRYGYGSAIELEQATYLAETPDNIYDLIMQISVFSHIEMRINSNNVIRCIGINGVDTSGKTFFSNRFASFLRSKGRKVAVIHLDDFHNPKEVRTIGDNEVDAYIKNAFDLDTLINVILLPLQNKRELHAKLTLLDLDSDTYCVERQYDILQDTLLIVEGVLLYCEPLADYIDFKVFLDIDFEEVIRRATYRDVPKYGAEFLLKYHDKYIPIQKWYLSTCRPKSKSDIVVNNQDFKHPFIE